MSRTPSVANPREIPDTIVGLWSLCALTPFRSRTAYENAAELCGRFAVRRLSSAQRNYFRELLVLIERYENEHLVADKSARVLRTCCHK